MKGNIYVNNKKPQKQTRRRKKKMTVYGNLTLSLKVAAVASTCVLSLGVMLKHTFSTPLVLLMMMPLSSSSSDSDSDSNSGHSFRNIFIMLQYCLKPPYLYLLINAIIISIVASSKLHHHRHDRDNTRTASAPPPPPSENDIIGKLRGDVILTDGADDHYGFAELDKPVAVSPPPPLRSDSMEFSDKPPVSSRFDNRKLAVKANPEGGRALKRKVSKSKRNETLESTWKTITEGRAMPLTRHLKKSDTWDSHVRQQQQPSPLYPDPKMKKSETFHEGSADVSGSANANAKSSRLKREPSLSQDELNRRVEAFIKKFNEEMRLQRQRSLEQYNQMINRGAN